MSLRILVLAIAGWGVLGAQPLPPPRPPRPGQAQQAGSDADPVDVLVRLRDEVLRHASRIPNYTCVETIARDLYEAAGDVPKSCDAVLGRRKAANWSKFLKVFRSDRLRLDVLMTATKEVYSWAGEGRFEDIDIDELIPEGAMGTGPFAAMLLTLFDARSPRFVYEGDASQGGRQLMEFTFTVPLPESHYRVKGRGDWAVTGYTGQMLVDPTTAELVKLNVRTDELPESTGECETETFLEYGKVPMGGIDYLLPKAARQRFVARSGMEAENQVSFSACREYRGESTLLFGDHGEGKVALAGVGASAPATLPAGLAVAVEVTTEIRPQQAAAGDRFEGRLAKAIVDQQQRELVAKGAKVEGRLMRVELRHSPPEYTVVMRLETLEIDGVKRPLAVMPRRRTSDLTTVTKDGLKQRGVSIELPLPSETHYGVYHFPGIGAIVPIGFMTEWTTSLP